jgi:hypothetical protein
MSSPRALNLNVGRSSFNENYARPRQFVAVSRGHLLNIDSLTFAKTEASQREIFLQLHHTVHTLFNFIRLGLGNFSSMTESGCYDTFCYQGSFLSLRFRLKFIVQ